MTLCQEVKAKSIFSSLFSLLQRDTVKLLFVSYIESDTIVLHATGDTTKDRAKISFYTIELNLESCSEINRRCNKTRQ
jgi:hypothetical protein